jgi:hypothetical protein
MPIGPVYRHCAHLKKRKSADQKPQGRRKTETERGDSKKTVFGKAAVSV